MQGRAEARRVLADIYRDLTGEDSVSMTTRAHFAAFIERKKLVISPASLDYYEGHSRRFLEWLGPKADGDIADVTKGDVTAYRNHVAKSIGGRGNNPGPVGIHPPLPVVGRKRLILRGQRLQ